MKDVNGTSLKRKSQTENSGSPVKRSHKSADGPSTSKKFRGDDDTDEDSFSTCSSNNESKAGVIESIHMRNFMCHSSMEVFLNPRINFVVGRNGSGKSAILTALVVGLGGKASATSRGNSLKEFIKKGMNTATIEIILKNTGQFSYKREEYGDRIIITRSISNGTGQSGYKIKTGQGEVISNKKEELERIVSAFKIQVDNPICILNQDTARTFLNSSDPQEKYKLFMKATQLEQIQRTYKESMLDKRRAIAIVNTRKESLRTAKREVADLEHKWKRVQSLNDYRKRSMELENELYWTIAVSEEKAVEKLEQEVESHRARCPDLQLAVDKETEQEQKLHLKLKEVEEQISDVTSRLAVFESRYMDSRDEVRRRKEKYYQRMKEFKSLQSRICRIESNINTLRQEIDKIQKNSGPDYAARRQKTRLEIQELENKLTDVQVTLKTNKHHFSQLSANAQKIKSKEFSLNQERQEKLRKIEQKQKEIQELKKDSHNSLTVFGAWVPRVKQRIEEAFKQRKFGKLPRGPIGVYIKLKDASWAPVLESFLGSFLGSYCVNSASDAQVLTQIFKEELGRDKKPTIITSRFFDKVHDVSRFAVQADGYTSILDSVIVSDAIVCNCLIDQREVESILLIPTSIEACEIMSDARRVPRNCKRAITKKGDQFYPDPNYRMYAGDGNTRAKYLQVSMQDAIRTAEEELKGYQFQKGEVEKQFAAVREELGKGQSELNAASATIKKLTADDLSIQSKLAQLRDMEEPEYNFLATLAPELEDYRKKADETRKEHDSLEAECQQLKDEIDEAEAKSSKIRETSKDIQVEERPLLAMRESVEGELKEILSRKNFREKRYNDLRQEIAKMETELHKQQQVAKTAVEDATKICSRIYTERPSKLVDRELKECKAYMASVEERSGSLENICAAYYEKKTKYEQIIEDMKQLEEGLTHLENMLKIRSKTYCSIQKLIGLRVQHMFQSLLHQRRYSGRILFDHEEQTLLVIVSPSEKQMSVADTKSLSGGERSYSTVSFIMALWDAVDPPFYLLDEFDVFMDKVNRRVIMDLLLAHSRQKTNFQFVFLTPQDTSSIQSDPDITIHRMQDPCRISNTQ